MKKGKNEENVTNTYISLVYYFPQKGCKIPDMA